MLNIKSLFKKENADIIVKEVSKQSVDFVSKQAKSFVNRLFYKVVIVIVLIAVLSVSGCVGVELITAAIKS